MEVIEVILGTYEEFLLGYELQFKEKICQWKQTFANHNHTSSVRCVASSGNLLLSGGADNNIYMFNLEVRKECGLLPLPATISCAAFTPNESHIVVGRGDGCLSFFKVGNFVLEKQWQSAHKESGIVAVSIHPSGKIALTVGNDGILKTWNLIKGRLAYAKAIARKKHFEGYQMNGVMWSESGEYYAVGVGSKVDVYSVKTAGIVCTASPSVRICSFHFVKDSLLAVGCENGNIVIVDITTQNFGETVKAHELRVKCLSCIVTEDLTCLVSASSNGEVKVWKVKDLEVKELAKIDTKCRITCLTISKHSVKENKGEELSSDPDSEYDSSDSQFKWDSSDSQSKWDSSDSQSKRDSSVSESLNSESDSDSKLPMQGKKNKQNSSEDLESGKEKSEKNKQNSSDYLEPGKKKIGKNKLNSSEDLESGKKKSEKNKQNSSDDLEPGKKKIGKNKLKSSEDLESEKEKSKKNKRSSSEDLELGKKKSKKKKLNNVS